MMKTCRAAERLLTLVLLSSAMSCADAEHEPSSCTNVEAFVAVEWSDIEAASGCAFFSAPAPWGHEFDLGAVGRLVGTDRLELSGAVFLADAHGFAREASCPWKTSEYRFEEKIVGAWSAPGPTSPACASAPAPAVFTGTYRYEECTSTSGECVDSGCSLTASVTLTLVAEPPAPSELDDETLCDVYCDAHVAAAVDTTCTSVTDCNATCHTRIADEVPHCRDQARAWMRCLGEEPLALVCEDDELTATGVCDVYLRPWLACGNRPAPTGTCQ